MTPFAHIAGLPVEESVLALAPAGGAALCAAAVVGRATVARLARWLRRP